MLKHPKLNFILLASAATALTLGAAAGFLLPTLNSVKRNAATPELAAGYQPDSEGLNNLSDLQLELIANRPDADLARSRARYILASRALVGARSEDALTWLNGLERDYTLLAPQILSLRAQAQTASGNENQAIETWKTLVDQHPQSPVSAEGWVALSGQENDYGDRAIAQHPAYPATVDLALQRLKGSDLKAAKQLPLMLLVARYGHKTEQLPSILEALIQHHGAQLNPEDWEEIAFAYWEKLDFKGAAIAYAKAPRTSQQLYRTARSLQLSEQQSKSRPVYEQVVQEFSKTDDAGLALKRLAEISEGPKALPYWEQLIADYPDFKAEALLSKAKLLDKLGSQESASQIRQYLLDKLSDSDAAAELRWELAEKYAAAQQYKEAAQLASSIAKNNLNHEIAPKAGFWAARWYQALGQERESAQLFETVLRQRPESYFAWRSAAILGLPVGDFLSVRSLTPDMVKHTQRAVLPSASDAARELYSLGEDAAAWRLWQVEFVNRKAPSVAEQFTDGLLRLGVGDNLDGLYMIGSLANREKPEDKKQYEALRQQPDYWYALYPLPFFDDIQQAALKQQLNPLLVTALIRQESRFMPGIKSIVGAEGLMQVMPETAEWVAPQAGLGKEFKLNDPLDNIQMGTWYLNYTHEEWDGNSMLAVASYNAGPGNVQDWVKRFQQLDVDTFVERIPFPETQGYVESVFENYWNYMRLYNPDTAKLVAQSASEFGKVAKR